MKIKYAVMSVDDSHLHKGFWPSIARAWYILGIEPILIDVGCTKARPSRYGRVVDMQPVSVPSSPPEYVSRLNACLARFWYCANHLKDDVCIITDIDMIPISRWYFTGIVSEMDEVKHVHLSPNIEGWYKDDAIIPVCYHIGKGSTLCQNFELDIPFDELLENVARFILGNSQLSPMPGRDDVKWIMSEEIYLTAKLKGKDLVIIRRRNLKRLDRSHWNFNLETLHRDFYDAHCPRPYESNSTSIDSIVDRLAEVYA